MPLTPVVAFTKDWNDVPTSTTHVLRAMGEERPVLWVSSIGVRKPNLGSGRDWRRIATRLTRLVNQRFEPQENQLSVLYPTVWPRAEQALTKALNRAILGRVVRQELRRHGAESCELWLFVPNAVDYIGAFGEEKVVYYCVDDWTYMQRVDAAWITACEKRLLQQADVVLATARKLVEKCEALADCPVHYQPHGVDHAKFSQALATTIELPAELAELPRPIVGFYGNLIERVDFGLISRLSKARREWSFVLIGPVVDDPGDLPDQPNVHLLGRREHDALPAYCKAFDVAIIPYDMDNPLNHSVNPIKARELLAAGVPLVTSPLPEMTAMGDEVLTAAEDEAWLTALETQLARQDRGAISERVQGENWPAKVRQIRQRVDAVPRRS